jgi:predicted short-subunit dehydrogenase-like oxidoreductase (DUF2520 family)
VDRRDVRGLERGQLAFSNSLSHLRLVLIGAGRVGTAVAELLRRRGHAVTGVASRSEASARAAADLLASSTFQIADDLPSADLYLLGVPGRAIGEVAERIADRVERGAGVWHFEGSVGIAPLEPLASSDAVPLALHPMQACPTVDIAIHRLPGSIWGVTCPEEHRAAAHDVISTHLHGRPIDVEEMDRPVWHAAAVTTSNGIASLLAIGEAMLESISIGETERVLAPLAEGTVANAVESGGGGASLTGPMVRGERETIALHLSALETRDQDLAALYRSVARVTVAAARRAGRLSDDDERRLVEALDK